MLDLVIVRHGESVRNHASDLAHRGDTNLLEYQLRFELEESAWDLTQRGIDQSGIAGTWIRENVSETFDEYLVSPFKRAQQTAANLALANADWTIDERLRERQWGNYMAPGIPVYTVDQYLDDLSFCGAVHWKREFPGAESVEDMIPRCHSFFMDLLSHKTTEKAIVVTHGGTMKAFQLVIERLSVDQEMLLTKRRLSNCSILHYRLKTVNLVPDEWIGRVRFASPAMPDSPVSEWEDIAGCTIADD